jgi:hypothetical protein
MTYKTLLLHVDDSKVCVERTDVGSILRKLLTLISLDSTASTHPFRATYKYRQRWSGRPLSLGDGEAGNDLAERDKERKITHRGVIEERRGLPSGEAWFACKGLIGCTPSRCSELARCTEFPPRHPRAYHRAVFYRPRFRAWSSRPRASPAARS